MVVTEHDEHQHSEVYSVSNFITVIRLLTVPVFVSVLLRDSGRSRMAAFVIYAIAASTDWVDGQIARRTHTVTNVGKILDPLVDRLLLAAGVLGLYVIDELPLWVPIVLLLRDAYLLYGSYVLERHQIRLPVTYIGKVTTAVLLTGLTSLIAGWPVVAGRVVGIWFVYIGTALSLLAAVGYSIRAWRSLSAAKAASTEA